MTVSSVVRRVTAGAAVLFLLSSPAVASPSLSPPLSSPRHPAPPRAPASRLAEPMPPGATPPPADPALLHREGTQTRLTSGAPRPPRLSARSWLVADARTGDVLAAYNAHRQLPPASTMKVLFALTLLPRLPQEKLHTVSEHELRGIGPGSSRVGIEPETTYRLSDLWNGVFLSSGNDAVRVLAGLNGGWESTIRQMQDMAGRLGAHDTRVVSPDGYDAPGQVSSAYDLALFARAGLRNPDFARYCSTRYAKFPARGWSFDIRNTNRLLTGVGVARYPGLIGVKNGYTSGAGHTLVAAAQQGGRTLIVTVMNPSRSGASAVYEEARALLDWGFSAAEHARPVGSLLPRPQPAESPAQAAAAPRPGALAASPEGKDGGKGEERADGGPGSTLTVVVVGWAVLAAIAFWLARRPRHGAHH